KLTKKTQQQKKNTLKEYKLKIHKILKKKAYEMNQTIKYLLLDVKNLKRELEFSEELERSKIPAFARSTNVAAGQTTENATAMQPAAISTQNSVSARLSSAEYLVSEIKNHKNSVAAILAILLLALAGSGYWFLRIRGAGTGTINSIAVMPFVNEGGNADLDYLSDGMTETLISSL